MLREWKSPRVQETFLCFELRFVPNLPCKEWVVPNKNDRGPNEDCHFSHMTLRYGRSVNDGWKQNLFCCH